MFTAAQWQTLTDQMAREVYKAYNPLASAYADTTNQETRRLLNTNGDVAAENALGSSATAFDEAYLPANAALYLAGLAGQARLQGLARDINAFVAAQTGGTLAAWLTANPTATTHPLAALLFRSIQGVGDPFNVSNVAVSVFPPSYTSQYPDYVYMDVDGALVDVTADATDPGTADFAPFTANNRTLYILSRRKLAYIVMACSTKANVTINPLIEYSNGSGYASAGATDNSAGFTRLDTIALPALADIQRTNLDKGGTVFPTSVAPFYVYRIQRQASTVGTPPVGTCIRVIAQSAVFETGGSAHAPVDQPPLGLFRIKADSTVETVAPVGLDYTRWLSSTAFKLRALTAIGTSTLTLGYTAQDATATTKAQNAFTTPAAMDELAGIFQTNKTGIRAVLPSTTTISTAATEGVFELYIPELRVVSGL